MVSGECSLCITKLLRFWWLVVHGMGRRSGGVHGVVPPPLPPPYRVGLAPNSPSSLFISLSASVRRFFGTAFSCTECSMLCLASRRASLTPPPPPSDELRPARAFFASNRPVELRTDRSFFIWIEVVVYGEGEWLTDDKWFTQNNVCE